jgi:homospermidine synthase
VLPFKAVTHKYGSRAAIYIDQPSCSVRVKSWSPNCLDFWAYLITHNEAISIADYLSLTKNGCLDYRPTCYYAYRPCDEAVESMKLLDDGSRYNVKSTRVIKEEIAAGIDELGVFLISEKFPALWLGSNLSIEKARKMAPHNNATSLQVAASVIAGIKWIEENPAEGLVESEELDHDFIYSVAAPYWSPIVSEFVDWRPSDAAPSLQFVDFLVRGVAA